MLYSLIPPIAIILSLVGIILFLMKKAPEIARLKDNGLGREKDFLDAPVPAAGRNLSGKLLLVLEKLTRRSKVFFLKLENIFTGWSETIKRKRNGRSADANPRKEETVTFNREKFNRPVLSEKITIPKTYAERKDIFENILIDRIAANPKDVEAYERLGEYYLEIGNWSDAKECFKQVIKLDVKNDNAKTKLKKLERMLG